MSSPDERQGDATATMICNICSEISRRRSREETDLSLRPTESAKSALLTASSSVAEEQTAASVAGMGHALLSDEAQDQKANDFEER
jgi:hypothetical protein